MKNYFVIDRDVWRDGRWVSETIFYDDKTNEQINKCFPKCEGQNIFAYTNKKAALRQFKACLGYGTYYFDKSGKRHRSMIMEGSV